ncbi:hypothetical protein CFter6_3891 [Collimonas fungivorans]|uniref:Uncharacterized protein n=2 Tax=Collimonas fungivorans TaxID=158899 RepID=A0A127PFE2_9BURK|nr:hypothetical protein CFter6_3891 [Collimonas fungivorans]
MDAARVFGSAQELILRQGRVERFSRAYVTAMNLPYFGKRQTDSLTSIERDQIVKVRGDLSQLRIPSAAKQIPNDVPIFGWIA